MKKMKKKSKQRYFNMISAFSEAKDALRADDMVSLFQLACSAGEIDEKAFAKSVGMSEQALGQVCKDVCTEIKTYDRKDGYLTGSPVPNLPNDVQVKMATKFKKLYVR